VWLKRKKRAIEIDSQSEVAQEVAAQNAALLEARCLVDRAEIQYKSAKVALQLVGHPTVADKEQPYILGNTCGADYAGRLPLDYLIAKIKPLDRGL
jgi:hypothetical protein